MRVQTLAPVLKGYLDPTQTTGLPFTRLTDSILTSSVKLMHAEPGSVDDQTDIQNGTSHPKRPPSGRPRQQAYLPVGLLLYKRDLRFSKLRYLHETLLIPATGSVSEEF